MKNFLTLWSSLTISDLFISISEMRPDLKATSKLIWTGFSIWGKKKEEQFCRNSQKRLYEVVFTSSHMWRKYSLTNVKNPSCDSILRNVFIGLKKMRFQGFCLSVSYLLWWSTSIYLFHLQETFRFPCTIASYVKIHMNAYIGTFKHIHLKNSPAYDKDVFWFSFFQRIC